MPGIRGGQIRDETIESVDIASGSIKMGEVSSQVISSQAAIDSVDTTNDMLLIYDANNDALKKVAPTNLGVGGSGSPGGSDTQVQFNDGGSFAGNAGLTFNKTAGSLTVAGDVSGSPIMLVDNDQSSAGHVMKLTTDGTGNGTNVLDMESASSTIFRARADGRFGFGPDGVDSMGAGTFVVGIDNSSHTADIAISKRLQHLGDSNTYMDFPAADQLQFVVGDVDILHVTEDDSQDKIVFNEGGADVDFRVESSASTHTLFSQGSSGFVGIGTSSPDGILHIDGGSSNTELIIEKDGNTTASIVFDVAGSRRFDITHNANEDLNFNSYSPNKDIFFNHTSDNGGTVRMFHIDGNDDGAVVVGNSVTNDPYSGATFIVTGTMGHGLGTAFFVTQSASVVPGLHLHNNRSTAETGIALRFSNHSVNAAASIGFYGQISLENTAASPGFQNPDMVFKIQDDDSFGAQNMVEAMRIEHGAAVKIAKHFGRTPSTALSLGSGTSSSVTPSESVMIINASSITAAANNMHTMTIANGTFSGQTVTFIFDNDFLDGDGGASDMGAIMAAGTLLGSHALAVIGSAMSGKSAAGSSFTLMWTGSAWAVISHNGLVTYPS